MKKLIGLISSAFVYFCVATTITIGIGVSVFAAKGGLSGDKTWQLMAVLNGFDLYDFWTRMNDAATPRREEQMSYEEVLQSRVKAGLDWDMRERALERAMTDLRVMEASYQQQNEQFVAERQRFVASLKQQQEQAQAVSLQEVQVMLDSLSPKQAKEQIKMWLDNPEEKYPIKGRNVLMDVVTILKATPTDRMAKIAKEFKTDEEVKMLHNILERIRVGPEEQLIDTTRESQGNSAKRDIGQRLR